MRVTDAAGAELDRRGDLLDARRNAGFVRQCHGDLHLRNIVLLDGRPTLFDGVGALGLLVLRAVVHGTVAALVDVTMLFVYFGGFSLWSFGYKLYRYGHALSPEAAVRVQPFMPPMFGDQQIANIEVSSYPGPASYALAGVVVLLFSALVWTWWHRRPRVQAGAAAAEADRGYRR